MKKTKLEHFLPEGSITYVQRWLDGHKVHIKITRERVSKLGDYRKLPDGSHQISVNGSLAPELFFFVLTHEIAHLLSFVTFGFAIAPHGKEWKSVYRQLLHESISCYPVDLQQIIVRFSKSPKANFMASPDLVRYFHSPEGSDQVFLENIEVGQRFNFRNKTYVIKQKRKKNYLCTNFDSGKEYLFKPLARVKKIN